MVYALHPACVHADASSAYFSLFLSYAAYIPSSHGTVSSAVMTVFVVVGQITMTGRRDVMTICCGNFSWRPRSALRSHSPPGDNRDLSHTKLLSASPPCLTNWIGWYAVDMLALFTSSLRVSMTSASFHRTRSWRHLYRPWVRAVLQLERMCCRLELWWPQGWQISSIPYQRCRFWGLGRVSYVALIRKLNLAWGSFHRSAHVMLLSIMASQVVHFPCWDWLTALTL